MSSPPAALLIIDIQHSLAGDTKSRIPHALRVRSAAEKLLAVARSAIDAGKAAGQDNGMVVFVQHDEDANSGDLVKGSKAWELVEGLEPREGEMLVQKRTSSAFEASPILNETLRARGIKHVFVCGIQSDFCVQATARGALKEGYEVSVLKGAHSTYDASGGTAEEMERIVEGQLEEAGAKIVMWDEAVKKWEEGGRVC